MNVRLLLGVVSCLVLVLICQAEAARRQKSSNFIETGRNENTNVQEVGQTRIVTSTITKFYTRAKTSRAKRPSNDDHHLYRFYKKVRHIDGQAHLNLTFKEYIGSKLVNTGSQSFVLEIDSPEKIKELYESFKHKVKSGRQRTDPSSSGTKKPETGKHIKYDVQFFNTTSMHDGKPRLTVIYKVYKNGNLVKRKTQRFYLKTQSHEEADKVFHEYKAKIRQLYKLGENEEKFSYIVGNGMITVFYRVLKKGKVIDSEAKTFPVEGNGLEEIQKIIQEFKDYIHENSGKASETIDEDDEDEGDEEGTEGDEKGTNDEVDDLDNETDEGIEKEDNNAEVQGEEESEKDDDEEEGNNPYPKIDEFPFTTNQATYNVIHMDHNELFSYTVDNGKLNATFKLYSIPYLIYETSELYPMESNTQGAIDKIMRHFTRKVHGGIEDQEEEDQKINENLEYQEHILYNGGGEAKMRLTYNLYHFGKLVHTNAQTYPVPSPQLKRYAMGNAIESIHRQREIYNDWLEFDSPTEEIKSQYVKKSTNGLATAQEDATSYKDISTFTSNQVTVSGTFVPYREQFSYLVKDGEMMMRFKLYNFQGNLVLKKAETFPLPDNNQAEIDKLMRGFISRSTNGTGEVWVDNEDDFGNELGDPNFELQEKFTYSFSHESLMANFDFYYYGRFTDSFFQSFPLSRSNTDSYDLIVFKHINAMHLRREDIGEMLIKLKQEDIKQEEAEEEAEKDYDDEVPEKVEYPKHDEFPFTTNQATYNVIHMEHNELFLYTVDNGKLNATFKLYSIPYLIYETSELYPMESNTQGAIDKIMRLFTRKVHEGIEDQEEEDQKINENLEFQEHILYNGGGEAKMRLTYNLYHFGKLVHTNAQTYPVPGPQLKRYAMGNAIESIHRQREIYNDWLEFDPPTEEIKSQYVKKSTNGLTTAQEDATSYKDISTFTSNQVIVSGRFVPYREQFSYLVKDGEMRIRFKLYNFQGNLVLKKTETFPLPDNNQAEIDKLMRGFISRSTNGTGEVWVDNEDIYGDEIGDPNIELQENFRFTFNFQGALAYYDLFTYGNFTSSGFKPLQLSQVDPIDYDNAFFKYIENVHLDRQKSIEDAIKLKEEEEERLKEEAANKDQQEKEEKAIEDNEEDKGKDLEDTAKEENEAEGEKEAEEGDEESEESEKGHKEDGKVSENVGEQDSEGEKDDGEDAQGKGETEKEEGGSDEDDEKEEGGSDEDDEKEEGGSDEVKAEGASDEDDGNEGTAENESSTDDVFSNLDHHQKKKVTALLQDLFKMIN